MEKKTRPLWRIPDTESNVPRLRPIVRDLDLVGFVHFPVESQRDDE